MRRRIYTPSIRDLAGAIHWLREHGVPITTIAQAFEKSNNYVAVADLHEELRRERGSDVVQALDTRVMTAKEDLIPMQITAMGLNRWHPDDFAEEVEQFAATFWSRVRFLNGSLIVGQLLRKTGKAASDNLPLLRVAGRLYWLEAEIYVHVGYALSALTCGLEAYGFLSYIHKHSGSRLDVERIGRVALLISLAFSLRGDLIRAKKWVRVAGQAFERANKRSAEYYRMLATLQFRLGADWRGVEKNFNLAEQALPEYNPNATEAAVRDIAERPLDVFGEKPKWEESEALFQYALGKWPSYDIHLAINLIWTAACGLLTDSVAAHRRAYDLLQQHRDLVAGFNRQATSYHLLMMTEQIPAQLRREWILFALWYNAYRNK